MPFVNSAPHPGGVCGARHERQGRMSHPMNGKKNPTPYEIVRPGTGWER